VRLRRVGPSVQRVHCGGREDVSTRGFELHVDVGDREPGAV